MGTIAELCRATSLQLRHVSTIRKKLVKQQYLLHVSLQYGELGPLTAEIGLAVCSIPANFNEFHDLASLLHWRRSVEVNQTLHDLWPSPGLLHYIYIFGGSCPLAKFCHLQNSPCVQVLRPPTLVALLHGTPAAGVSQTATWYKKSQRAPPIFDWAAITMGIGPHSS